MIKSLRLKNDVKINLMIMLIFKFDCLDRNSMVLVVKLLVKKVLSVNGSLRM